MIKIIVTLGPASNSLDQIVRIKSKGVDFVRINMSHSSIEDLIHYIGLAKQANIPFIIDKGIEWYTNMGVTYGDARFDPPKPDQNTGTWDPEILL